VKIQVEGIDKIDLFLKDVVDDIQEEVLTTLQSEIKKRTPIDTGQARRGWKKRTDSVRNDVPYIGRLERGYSRQAPKGFTKQAIRATIAKRKSR